MPLILDDKSIERILKRKGRRVRKGRLPRSGTQAENQLRRSLNNLWRDVLLPATEDIKRLVKSNASPGVVAARIEQALRAAEDRYELMGAEVVLKWRLSLGKDSRQALQRALRDSLGVDLAQVFDAPTWVGKVDGHTQYFTSQGAAEQAGAGKLMQVSTRTALELQGLEAASLIKRIPGQYLGEVAQAVRDNFLGVPLPEGRTLVQQLEHLGAKNRRHARLLARDQTTKLQGALNQARQQGCGIETYVWRTVKDQRVVGKPDGMSPRGNSRHGNHYVMEGKLCRWDDPTVWSTDNGKTWEKRGQGAPLNHPGEDIQCRCSAEPIINVDRIIQLAQAS